MDDNSLDVVDTRPPASNDEQKTNYVGVFEHQLMQYIDAAISLSVEIDVVNEISLVILTEVVTELCEEYLMQRTPLIQNNPLIQIVNQIVDETNLDCCHDVVQIMINEFVDKHLKDRIHSKALNIIVEEYFDENMNKLAIETYLAVSAESMAFKVTNEVLATLFADVAKSSIDDFFADSEEFYAHKDKAAIAAAVQQSILPRVAIGHLIMSIINKFDSVLIAHLAKGIMIRQAIARLVSFMHSAESRILPLTENQHCSVMFEKLALSVLQDEVVKHFVNESDIYLNEIDQLENEFYYQMKLLKE